MVTHFIDEAERLCDRNALIDCGRVIAMDTLVGLAEPAGWRESHALPPSRRFDDVPLTGLPEVDRLEHQAQSSTLGRVS